MTQDEALAIMKTGVNVFLTGEPGSGKTHTVNRYSSWLREHDIEPAVTASTGIAATHIGGHTIHSWCGIGIKRYLSSHDLSRIAANKKVAGRVRNARILIIDEISMLSAQTFRAADAACRAIRGSASPFGGLQLILVGDFFQLPPITERRPVDEDSMFIDIPLEEPQAPFAFTSPLWDSVAPTVCYLSEQHRQEDAVFLELLSALRLGKISLAHRALLNSRRTAFGVQGATKLLSHNIDVDRMNAVELLKLKSEEHVFPMETRGPANLLESLKRGCLSPETLALKIGARVMFTKNDNARRYVNGTLGVVTGFSNPEGYPIVTTNAGREIWAEPVEWTIEEGGRILAGLMQIPLRLAWAITVHKSQGMSLDAAYMDLTQAFEYGQGYVALSRLRTLAGLTLAGFNERALQVHPGILIKDTEFRRESETAREMFAAMVPEELTRQHDSFIHACGGTIQSITTEKLEDLDSLPIDKVIRKKQTKGSRWEQTLVLVHEGKTIETIASEQNLKPATIIHHLEELLALQKLYPADIAYLVRGSESSISKAQDAFRDLGDRPLKPVYEHFEGKISYDILHLARLLF